jgi:hypothetical protein
MTRHGYSGPDVRDPEQRAEAFAGLHQRLVEKAEERQRLFLPVFRPAQIADRKAAK